MDWKIAQKQFYPDIRNFILKREWTCCSFSSIFKEYNSLKLKPKENIIIFVNQNGKEGSIQETVMFTQHGIIYPVFNDYDYSPSSYSFKSLKLMIPYYTDYLKNLHSIIGIDRHVLRMEQLLGRNPIAHVEYYLMAASLHDYIPPDHKINKLKIRIAKSKDVVSLFPLQKAYEYEEVYINPKRFDPELCMTNLKQTIKKELIFIAEIDKIPVAKAGTNAQGYKYNQIGGVFTNKKLRKKGIGSQVVAFLCEHIFNENKAICLFVKKTNIPALKLYKKLGFQIKDNFRISYFK